MTTMNGRGNPRWVRVLLAQPWTVPLARVAMAGAFGFRYAEFWALGAPACALAGLASAAAERERAASAS